MATMNVSLPENMKAFVEAEVAAGGYSTTSEYFRALVREAQERKAKTRLEALLLEGLRSSDTAPIIEENWDDILREVKERITRRKMDALREQIVIGEEQLARGEYSTYHSGKELADQIKAEGRKRLENKAKE